jgi:FlaA1/EpsC-like NDP-sugar epimerase
MPHFTRIQRTVIAGDVVVLVLLTVAGFAAHVTLDALGRMVVTTAAALLAWGAVAPFMGIYSEAVIADPRAVWRVGWAWLLAAPLATFLRGVALDRDIPWQFILVTILLNGFALVAWRVVHGWVQARRYGAGSTSTMSPR